MKLTIIIVHYNVKYFLEHCLLSVQAASKNIKTEIIVIDNNSTDNSIQYLQPLFPQIIFIKNVHNNGFGKACNQGLVIAKGEYVLFLNPDTLIPEDSFTQCLSCFTTYENAGAIGVKMIDGKGRFLKESKRGFPSPLTSFYKLFGLAAIFPKSSVFSKYYLGNLDENTTCETIILAGAYMMVRKAVLDKTGGFDERFFMYGEDIDLSYRIHLAGWKNYYVATAPIIHFKGGSTATKGFNYTKTFYGAMTIFVKKYYAGSGKRIFSPFILFAIWLRASLSIMANGIKKISLIKKNSPIYPVIVVGTKISYQQVVQFLNDKMPNQITSMPVPEFEKKIIEKPFAATCKAVILCEQDFTYSQIIKIVNKMPSSIQVQYFSGKSII